MGKSTHGLVLFLLFCLGAAGRAWAQTGPQDFYQITLTPQQTHDFVARQKGLEPFGVSLDCKAKIPQLMCLVEPVNEGGDFQNRPCLPGGRPYASYFETLYDAVPPALQKMFCSLSVIYVEKQFFGTAYAGLVKDPGGKPIGAVMGIRQSVLDQALQLQNWATWKEQLSFGGPKDSYTSLNDLPQVVTQTTAPVQDFLYFVVVHEFGHMFDFTNELNQEASCALPTPDYPDGYCTFTSGSWGTLSWAHSELPLTTFDFPFRKDLCFYSCQTTFIPKTAMAQLYGDLYRGPFISTYAATNPWDDFADSLAYYLASQQLHSHYKIGLPSGEEFDMMGKLDSPQFAAKKAYLEQFLQRKHISYPGQ